MVPVECIREKPNKGNIGPVLMQNRSAQRRGEPSMECEVPQAKRCRYVKSVL